MCCFSETVNARNLCHCVHPCGSSIFQKNVFSENAVGYLRMLELSNLCHCVQHPCSAPLKMCFEKMLWVSQKQWMLELSGVQLLELNELTREMDLWSSRNERKPKLPLSKLKHVFRTCSGVSQKWWMLELSNLCHCVQHPWKLTGRDFWSSRNERKPLSKPKHVLRKCCGVSQKQWMLELSNLCHCVQHPWKLNSRDYWSSMNERKPLLQQICVLRKCCGDSQKW